MRQTVGKSQFLLSRAIFILFIGAVSKMFKDVYPDKNCTCTRDIWCTVAKPVIY